MALTESTMLSLGTTAPDFELPGTGGKTYTLNSFSGAKALLIVFTCNHCPYALAFEDRFIRIANEFSSQGLATLFICSNDEENYPDDSFEKMKGHAIEKSFPFPYCQDASQEVARSYAAACTPDPYLFDCDKKLVYRGRVDDNWEHPEKAAHHDLRNAVQAVLEGQPVSENQYASLGCNIKWLDEKS
jgi:peroxiredoxin